MDKNEKSLLRLHIISWTRSGGRDKVSWEQMLTYYKIDPIVTMLVIQDTLFYLELQTIENFQHLTEALHKLS